MCFIIGEPLTGVSLYAERLTVALGFVTLFFVLATFLSCRACLSFLSYLGVKNLVGKKWFLPFYKYHGYFMYGFLFMIVLHLMSALMHTALPTIGDPDGLIHLIILSFGFVSFILAGVNFSSCRSLVGLLNLFTEKGPLSNRGFQSFYRFHNLSWAILFLAIVGHFASGYVHVGFWPR